MHRLALTAVAALAALGIALPAAADESACLPSHTEGQRLRKAGKLVLARERFLECAASGCASMLVADCASWLAEVDIALPSIVFGAKDGAGRELVDVRVLVDARSAVQRLDGSPFALDPGSHTIRFEGEHGESSEQTVLVKSGEKNRLVTATLSLEDQGPPPKRVASYVAAGVGALATVSFVVFAVSGQSQYDDLQDTCAPHCAPADSDSVRSSFLVANISLGVAAVALGSAAFLFFTSEPQSATPTVSFGIGPSPSGAHASVAAHF